ncbi:MAG: PAS domain S-box protein [Desulfobacterales bacterium]|nr:PAS domain S-box protein [Desulfobacterales bacterium]
MAKKPTYEELEQRVKELEKEAAKRKRAEVRIEHLNAVLRAIRNVNQLIAREKDRDRLLKAACDILTETRGYFNAWIALTDESGALVTAVEAGLGEDFLPMLERLKRGELTECAQRTLRETRLVVVEDPYSTCSECPLSKNYSGRGAMTKGLEYGGKVYGLLSSSVPRDFVTDEQEQALFEEVAGDIAFALHSIELEEERKRAEEALRESEKKYSTLVENSLTGIYIDQDEKIVFANDRFAEIYRYPREELIGIETWRLVHPEDRGLTSEIRAKRLTGEDAPLEYEARGLTKDGETIWITRRNARIEYKGRPVILGNIVDITEKKRAEEELRKINEELKNFVHVVSHDLKTPIISVQGFSSRLLKKYQEKLDEKAMSYLEQIQSSARRMELFVSDLLSLARIGQVVSTFKDVSSSGIVKDVVSRLQLGQKEKEIKLDVVDILPTISCDRERMSQVFENLLVNAIKFMGDSENPKIEIGCEDRGDFHQFYVKDNGIGIDPKYQQRIFDMFQRVREIEDKEGTGIGLAIVDRIVKSHGGEVWVDSEKAKGATFYFTLPKASWPRTHP